MEKIFKHDNHTRYKDFGVMVSKNNIEEHLKKQHSQYRKIDLKEILDTIYKKELK